MEVLKRGMRRFSRTGNFLIDRQLICLFLNQR